MSELSYAALPDTEKRAAAIDLARDHNTTQIAELLGVGWHRVKKWLDPRHAIELREREASRMRAKRMTAKIIIGKCDCADSLVDPLADSYFKRKATCVYCGKGCKR